MNTQGKPNLELMEKICVRDVIEKDTLARHSMENKTREFWIWKESELRQEIAWKENEQCIYVIEKSAYEDLGKDYDELYADYTNMLNSGYDKLQSEITHLKSCIEVMHAQQDKMSKECISLFLHDQRVAQLEAENDKLKSEYNEILEPIFRDKLAALEAQLAKQDKAVLELVEALRTLKTEEFYWVYEPHRDENNKLHPGLMKTIFEIRKFANDALKAFDGEHQKSVEFLNEKEV